LTFMNRCGQVVPGLLRTRARGAFLVAVYDSLDLSTGNCRFRLRGSSGGHKGLASLIEALGSEEFPRLAVGIGRPPSKDQVIEYVLSEPSGAEAALFRASIAAAADAVLAYSRDGPGKVMNELHRRQTAAATDG
jgi:peptidyl-tRNA hydrolase, PTH1 family